MTQLERVKRQLHVSGSEGITPVDFMAPNVIDGGAPILRLAARIKELREQGYVILSYRQPDSTFRYILAVYVGGSEEPREAQGDGRGGPVPVERLGASEGLVREGQHSLVVVDADGDGTSPADLPSEGLFSTDDYRPAPEYPR